MMADQIEARSVEMVLISPLTSCVHLRVYFTTAHCPLIVPHLNRPFTQISSWCLGLKHPGLLTFCAPLRDCEAVIHIHKLSCKGSLFVTQISLMT